MDSATPKHASGWMDAGADRQVGLTADVATARAILGIGRTKAYELVKSGGYPVTPLCVGRRYLVPTEGLLALLATELGPRAFSTTAARTNCLPRHNATPVPGLAGQCATRGSERSTPSTGLPVVRPVRLAASGATVLGEGGAAGRGADDAVMCSVHTYSFCRSAMRSGSTTRTRC
jgi:hypothetical protein